MNDTSCPRPTSGLSRKWLILMGLATVVLCGSVVVMLSWQRQVALTQEEEENANIARALREHTLRILENVNQAMLRLSEVGAERAPTDLEYLRFANETGLVPGILTQLSWVGADGRFVGSNLDPTGERSQRVDLSQRDHVRVHLSDRHGLPASSLSADGLFVSQILTGKVSGKRSLQLSRKVYGRDGSVKGVVVASLNPEYFESVYRDVRLGGQGRVMLAGVDGIGRILVLKSQQVDINQPIPTELLHALTQQREGALSHTGVDGTTWVNGYSRVGHYPLAVMLSTTAQTALTPWYTMRAMVWGLTCLLTLVLLFAAWVVHRSLQTLQRQHMALQHSQSQVQQACEAQHQVLVALNAALKPPLTTLQSFAELIALRSAEPRSREHARLILQNAQDMEAQLSRTPLRTPPPPPAQG
ncbi:MAG: hypothetical protein RLZZ494_2295 [Pseudomonadota bacterium]|uniref:cache domain-containing protein n=1 Tax=Vitreoscilla filiformis TaxID=63 RepID=UPI000B79F073|nr:cache domain-containing protein [Vitreoscilla filiformis]